MAVETWKDVDSISIEKNKFSSYIKKYEIIWKTTFHEFFLLKMKVH